jgi:hypothetical protein
MIALAYITTLRAAGASASTLAWPLITPLRVYALIARRHRPSLTGQAHNLKLTQHVARGRSLEQLTTAIRAQHAPSLPLSSHTNGRRSRTATTA